MALNIANVVAVLESPANEGYRGYLYDDARDAMDAPIVKGYTVKGNPTWGIGCNVASFRLSRERARIVCGWQVSDIWAELLQHAPWVDALDDARKEALANMAFNLGVPRLMGFTQMMAALKDRRWSDAQDEALASEWQTEEPARSAAIAEIFAYGGASGSGAS